MLAGLFVWQGVIFSAAVVASFALGGSMPELGHALGEHQQVDGGHHVALLGTSVAANRKPSQESKETSQAS